MHKRRVVREMVCLGLFGAMMAGCGSDEDPVNTATGTAAGPVAWTQVASGDGEQAGWLISATKAGQIIVVGTMQGKVDFGAAGTIASVSDSDLFVAWVNRDGKVARVRRFGEKGGTVPTGLVVDASGGIVISGVLMGEVDFGGGKIVGKGGPDAFLASFGADGQYRFAVQAGNADAQTGGQIALADAGAVFWTGSFEGTLDIGGTPLTSAGQSDMFVARIDSTGKTQWARSLGGAGYEGDASIAALPNGRVITSGYYEGAPDLGGGALPDTGMGDGQMLAILAEDGSLETSRGLAQTTGFFPYSVQVDEAGSPWLVGIVGGEVDLFGTKLSAPGQGFAIAKLDASGAPLLTQVFGGEQVEGVQATPARGGGLVVAGHFAKTMDIAGKTMTSAGEEDLFLVWVDAEGRRTQHERAGGTGRERLGGVTMLSTGQVVVTGAFEGAMTVGGATYSSVGGADAFVMMMN